MKVNGREIVLWECDPDAEHLHHENIDEAVEAYLERMAEQGEPIKEGELAVFGYARMEVPVPDAMWVLESLYAGPWEELLDPEGDITYSTELVDAAKRFCEEAARLFDPWACEVIHTETVDVAEWIAKRKMH